MAITERSGLPIAVFVASASPHEVTLIDETIDACYTIWLPERLIGDKAFDSDDLDANLLEERGIEMIVAGDEEAPEFGGENRLIGGGEKRLSVVTGAFRSVGLRAFAAA